ncbi:uncharacterized protein FOMMEDRAFT_147454 [Fomitiporia mediterranea MF3/22]|uniref:uncharacterized protein n=1 Tax=Fomitiporia mediterranea (strain MF3/22) TaxID=694068 RepID=UPI0004409AF3|nr:uncharacterized protein FOMMEDRAFT_147454 [Fomitiporia mediterranea MF3/22]EJD02502.1 hypothetical protein FOMMEDRAFT_147454 [Fomitiporia mediterranea MF3/22]
MVKINIVKWTSVLNCGLTLSSLYGYKYVCTSIARLLMTITVSDAQTNTQQIEWKKTATPLTVKQILNASQLYDGADITLDGRKLGCVYCVGNVQSIRVEETYAVLEIEDGTTSSTRSLSAVVFEDERGLLTAFKCMKDEGKIENSIKTRGISRVEDPHQIFYHFFECAIAYMECKKSLSSMEDDEREQAAAQENPSSEPGNRDTASKDEEEEEQPPQEPPEISQSDESSDDEVEYADDNPVSIEDSSSDEDEDHDVKQKAEVMSTDDSNSNTSKEEDDETNPTPVCTSTRTQSQAALETQTETEVDNVPCTEGTDKELKNVEGTLKKLHLTPADHSAASPDAVPQVQPPRAQSQPQANTDPLSGLTNVQRVVILHIQQRRDQIWAEGEEDWFGLHVSELVRVVRRLEKGITASEIR